MDKETDIINRATQYVLSNQILRGLAIKAMSSLVNNPLHRLRMVRVMSRHQEIPEGVSIEITNACNLRCIICPHRKLKRKVGFMDMTTYKKIVNSCVKYGIDNLGVGSSFGESTLDPSLVDKVAYAKRRGLGFVGISSNCTVLSAALSKKLIEARLDHLHASIDAATPETFEKMRPPGRLEVVEANLRNFIKIRNSMKLKKPIVEVAFEKAKENMHEVEAFKRKWKGVADKIYIGFVHNWGGLVDTQPLEFHGGTARRQPCPMIWISMVVLWDGRVPLCCLDCEGEVILGSIEEATIKGIWHSKKLQRIRRAHLDGKLNAVPLCKRCNLRSSWWVVS